MLSVFSVCFDIINLGYDCAFSLIVFAIVYFFIFVGGWFLVVDDVLYFLGLKFGCV